MKKIGSWVLAIFFPWLVFLLYDDVRYAAITFLLQATLVGWLPAIIMARRAQKQAAQ